MKIVFALALVAASPALKSATFASARYERSGAAEKNTYVNRPEKPAGKVEACAFPSDYRCPSAN